MKISKLFKTMLLLATLSFSLNSCTEDPPAPSGNNNGGGGGGGGGGSTYSITFWSNFSGSPMKVYVNGSYKGTITSVLSSTPSCGASGCVTVSFSSPGTVSYSADDGDYTWSGTTTISSSCKTVLLHL